jgi:bifunctional non-homologous end joining protein LigD
MVNLKSNWLKIKPMLAFPSKPFDSPYFIFEPKFDGTRCLIYLSNNKYNLINRRLVNITHRYPEFENITKQINAKEAIIDGEIVVLREGKSDFQALQQREHVDDPLKIDFLSKELPAICFAFDILYKDGKDLTKLSLIERKRILKQTIKEDGNIIVSDFIEKFGMTYFEKAKKFGFEGIMAKRKDSKYEIGKRSRNWLKIKALETFDCIICGFTEGKGKRVLLPGALVLGMYYNRKLTYVGRVGTGWDEKTLKQIYNMMKNIPGRKLFDVEKGIKVNWVKPKIVASIKAISLTSNKKLRAPIFKFIRDDKDPKECKLEDYL